MPSPGARLAAPALDVEAEPARHVAAHLGLVGRREQLADAVEHPGVGRRVGPRRAPDRRLVHVDDLVEVLDAGDPLVLARRHLRRVDALHQHRQEDVADQRRLARTGHAGDRDEVAERDLDREVLQVVLTGTLDDESLEPLRPALLRNRDRLLAGQVLPGDRLLDLHDPRHEPGVDDLATVLAGAGTDVDDPVALADRLLVVLDDDHRVAEVAQPGERVDQPAVVALVQADRRLVEHVQRADETGADLRRQPDALRLAAGERAGRT